MKEEKIDGPTFDKNNFKITKLEYPSFDGELIPLILIHHKAWNPHNPSYINKVLVKSYGCYGMPTEIGFSISDWVFLENDYIIAYPLIRGGGDKGIYWHS